MRRGGIVLVVLLGLAWVGWSAAPLAEPQTSRAYFGPEGEVAPVIQIRGTQVTVRHRAEGSGEVRGTALRGSRTYTFTRNGTYTVEPGQYKHLVYGQVPSGGSIVSILQYQ